MVTKFFERHDSDDDDDGEDDDDDDDVSHSNPPPDVRHLLRVLIYYAAKGIRECTSWLCVRANTAVLKNFELSKDSLFEASFEILHLFYISDIDTVIGDSTYGRQVV